MVRNLLTYLVFTLLLWTQVNGEVTLSRSTPAPPEQPVEYIASPEPAIAESRTGFNNEADDKLYISFYPNPVKDVLNIRFRDKGDHTIKIFNLVGTMLKEKSVNDDNFLKMEVSDLPKGVYFISYEPLNGKMLTKTFTKDQ
jgi:hypothetical protein